MLFGKQLADCTRTARPPQTSFHFAAILLLESAPHEGFTGGHGDLPVLPKDLSGRFLLSVPARALAAPPRPR